MLSIFFIIILLVHGFVHLMGFAHEFKFAEEESVVTNESVPAKGAKKVEDFLWLAAYAIFIVTLILFILHIPYWWAFGLAAIFLSQVLIIVEWNEAKYGTLLNIVILLAIISFLS